LSARSLTTPWGEFFSQLFSEEPGGDPDGKDLSPAGQQVQPDNQTSVK